MSTVVVTDSTANVPLDRAAALGISVVPMVLTIDGRDVFEGDDSSSLDVVAALNAGRQVGTAHPGPEAFATTYRAAAAAGADSIVSVHVSSKLSGTYASARIAAAQSPVPTIVVDSLSVGLGLGFAVMAAAQRASEGANVDAVADEARAVASGVSVWFCVDNLDALRRGGRIGAARALVGNALSIKPLLALEAGEVVPFDRVRTTARAMVRLEDVAVERALLVASQIAVHHLDAADRAEALAARLRERCPTTPVMVSQLTAVVSAHTGPGTVAVVVAPDWTAP